MKALSSTITKVVVYRRGARIERRVQLPEGTTQFRLIGLPPSLDDSTLRLTSGEGARPCSSIQVQRVVLAPLESAPKDHESADTTSALQRHRTASVQFECLKGDLKSLTLELSQVQKLSVLPRPTRVNNLGAVVAPEPTPHQSRLALLHFMQEASERLHKEIIDTQRALVEAEQQVATLKDTLDRLSDTANATPQTLYKSIYAEVVSSAEATTTPSLGEVVLHYFVRAARWEPSYRLRLETDLKTFTLHMLASVAQYTGENWSGVPLSISSAEAQRWYQLPTMRSIRIGRAQTESEPPSFAAPQGGPALFGDHDRSFGRESTLTDAISGAFGTAPEALFDDTMPEDLSKEGDDFDTEVMEEVMIDAVDAPPDMILGERSADPVPMLSPEPPMLNHSMSSMHRSKKRVTSPRDRSEPVISGQKLQPASPPSQPNFSLLRMPNAQHPQRGGLITISRSETYAEHLNNAEPSLLPEATNAASAVNIHAIDALNPQEDGRVDIRHSCTKEGYAHIYRATTEASVPSNGKYTTIHVSTTTGECAVGYACVPSVAPHVFRSLRLTNPLNGPLLAGPIDTYLGDAFLLGTHIRTTGTTAELEMGLGVEQAIEVVRRTRFEESAAGLMGKKRTLKHHIDIELKNALPFDVMLYVRERIPGVPKDQDDIQVEVAEAKPPWQDFSPREYALQGGKEWHLILKQGEHQKLRARYTISIPSAMEMVGGNRRN